MTPDKGIKGRFLRKDVAKFKDSDLGGTGAGGRDVRADFRVRVR